MGKSMHNLWVFFFFFFFFFLTCNILQIDAKFGDWLCWGLMTCQPLWVILCHLQEKGRREIEEKVEDMNKRDRGKWVKVKKQKK